MRCFDRDESLSRPAIPPLYVMFQAIRERVGPGSRPKAEHTETEKQDKPGSATREHVAAE
jgi:hypothetical protein